MDVRDGQALATALTVLGPARVQPLDASNKLISKGSWKAPIP